MSAPRWHKEDEEEAREPEITLSTASLLALFLGLVLVCGVFFGFGYSVGKRAPANLPLHRFIRDGGGAGAQPISSATPDAAGAPAAAEDSAAAERFDRGSSSPVSAPGSAPGSPELSNAELSSTGFSSPSSAALSGAPSDAGNITPLPVLHKTPPPAPGDAGSDTLSANPSVAADQPASAAIVRRSTPTSRARPALAAYSPGKTNATQPEEGHPMVQVAAVVQREDAEVLVSALRKRGYNAVVRTEPQDKFLHVQVGPFASLPEANAMRKKLFSDGYNAIIKQ